MDTFQLNILSASSAFYEGECESLVVPTPDGKCGVLKNEDGVITSIISKDEAQACEIDELVEKRFSGSLPAFVAAFAKRRDMSERELDEVQRMIDSIRNGGGK